MRSLLAFPLLLLALLAAPSAARDRLALRHVSLELPGAPASILAADLDGDGRRDLVITVAYTEWGQIGFEESTTMDGVEGLVEVLTIVPALTDRREVRLFLADGSGGYAPAGAPFPLETSVLSLGPGPPGMPVVAVTDDGVAALRCRPGEDGVHALALEPVIAERPVIAGSGTFVPELARAVDLDGDERDDLLFPADDGAVVYLARDGSLAATAASRLELPSDTRRTRGELVRHYPLPEARDVDGDALPDLLLPDFRTAWQRFYVLRNLGGGRFGAAVGPFVQGRRDGGAVGEGVTGGGEAAEKTPQVVYFGDLDGDGVAEYVTQLELTDEDAGFRQEMREAKDPPFRYHLHRARPDLTPVPEPYQEFQAVGYAFAAGNDDGGDDGGGDEIRLPGGLQDLDGDGRLDLIALTLDFSLLQAVRILTVKSISVGLDFHVWCQGSDGRFRPVTGLDLSGKFRLNLDNLQLGQLSQFAGDFDGDGRADFVQMGRGRTVTIHRGRSGCSYPAAPDLTLELAEEPRNQSLVQVRDLDGDALSDLLIIQPQRVAEPGVTPPVRLELYLSGGGV